MASADERTMVERVARAIFRGEKGREADPDFWTTECTGAHLYRDMARAAIAAMREPTPEMLRAMNSWAVCAGYMEEGWAAAIDTALKEPRHD